jgi:hypothetical protein
MRLERFLPVAVLALMGLWSIGFMVAILRDSQLPGDMAVGAVIAAVLLPVFAACVLGLLFWPLVRAIDEGDDQQGRLPNER